MNRTQIYQLLIDFFVVLRNVWRYKWGLVRLLVAIGLLSILVADNPARLARLQFASLPSMDYLAEVQKLRQEKRYAEALMVTDAGLEEVSGERYVALLNERQKVIEERDSVLRKGKEFVRGAVIGEGDSLEALVGAVAADMFVVGDIRDLVIEGWRLAVDGDADEFILVLSAVGVLTTVMPEIDWVAAFLKIAKKASFLSKHMVEALLRILRRAKDTGDYEELRRVFGHVKVLLDKSTPAGALRLLRHVDDPNDIAVLSDFLKRQPSGGFVLHVSGKEGVEILKSAGRNADDMLVLATKKGDRRMAWLRSGNHRLLRPHLLVGIAKGLHKGNVQRALERIAREYLDPYGWVVIPACALWVLLEFSLLCRRLFPWIARRQPATQLAAGS